MPPDTSITVSGSGNVVAAGSGNVVNINQTIRPKVTVKTGDGVLDAEQKAAITEQIRRWIASQAAVRKKLLTPQAAWAALNKRMRVNSYHEIPSDRFEAAMTWLRQQTGRIQSMPSAPKKDPSFRADAIKFIKARCKQLGDPDLYRVRAQERFGSSSLADLTNEQLQDLRKWLLEKH